METIDREFTEFLASAGKGFGLHDLMLNIFAVLFLEPDEIAMEDIAKKTGYSLASISNTTKILENIGFLQRKRKPGSKKVFFFMEKDIIRWNINKLVYASENMIKPAKEKLPLMLKKYKAHLKNDNDKKKYVIVENYYNQVLVFEKVIDRWRKDLEALSLKAI